MIVMLSRAIGIRVYTYRVSASRTKYVRNFRSRFIELEVVPVRLGPAQAQSHGSGGNAAVDTMQQLHRTRLATLQQPYLSLTIAPFEV